MKTVIGIVCLFTVLAVESMANSQEEVPPLYLIKEGYKFGYMNRQGAIVVEPQYTRARDFSDGMGCFFVAREAKNVAHGVVVLGDYGFYDSTGKVAIQPQYKDVSDFSCGLARVYVDFDPYRDPKEARALGAKTFLIDRQGRRQAFVTDGEFSDGLAPRLLTRDEDDDSHKPPPQEVAYIAPAGVTAFVIKPPGRYSRFVGALPVFHEGMAAAGRYYLNNRGEWLTNTIYAVAGNFQEGFAAVRLPGENNVNNPERIGFWGFIDKTGKMVLPLGPEITQARGFSEGLAAVHIARVSRRTVGGVVEENHEAEHWGFIDKTGKIVLEFKMGEIAGDFHEKLAWVRDGGDAVYVDKTGKKVIHLENGRREGGAVKPQDFKGGLARVIYDVPNRPAGEWTYIDRTGRAVWKEGTSRAIDAMKGTKPIEKLGVDAIPSLLNILGDQSQTGQLRENAVVALEQICRQNRPQLPAKTMQQIASGLVKALNEGNHDLRSPCVSALGEVGPRPEVVDVLVGILGEYRGGAPDYEVAEAAGRLGGFGPPAAPAVPALKALVAQIQETGISDESQQAVLDAAKAALKSVGAGAAPQPRQESDQPPVVVPAPVLDGSVLKDGIVVDAKRGWVDTGLTVHKGQMIGIRQRGGAWAVGAGLTMVDGNGHINEMATHLRQFTQFKMLPTAPFGCLIASINQAAPPFAIGVGKAVASPADGKLYLRINDNDQGLADNIGSITVDVLETTKSSSVDTSKPRPSQQAVSVDAESKQVSTGTWQWRGDTLAQTTLMENATFMFGNEAWSDYEFSVEARKDSGNEGFLILCRYRSERDYYWLNFGGWQNTKYALERVFSGSKSIVGSKQPGKIQTGRWYPIRVRCEGKRIQVWLDGQAVCDLVDSDAAAHLNGRVGVGTWNTAASFRNFKVTSLQGATLSSGVPTTVTNNTGAGCPEPVAEVETRKRPPIAPALVVNKDTYISSDTSRVAEGATILGLFPGAERMLLQTRDGALQTGPVLAPQEAKRLTAAARRARSAFFSADGNSVGVITDDGQIDVWNARNGTLVWSLPGDALKAVTAVFSQDARLLAVDHSMQKNSRITVWDTKQWHVAKTLELPDQGARWLSFSADGRRIYYADSQHAGTVELATGRCHAVPLTFDLPIHTMAFDAGSGRMAGVWWDLYLLDGDRQQALFKKEKALEELERVEAVVFSPCGNYALLGGDLGSIAIVDTEKGTICWSSHINGEEMITRVAFSADMTRILAVTVSGAIYEWASSSRSRQDSALAISDQQRGCWDGSPLYAINGSIDRVRLSPDGKRLIWSRAVVDALTGVVLWELPSIPDEMVEAAFSSDNRILATTHMGGTLRLWNAVTGQQLRELPRMGGWRTKFVQEDKRLVTDPGEVLVLDVKTAEVVLRVKQPEHGQGWCISGDGKRLAGGPLAFGVYDTLTGTTIREFAALGDVFKVIPRKFVLNRDGSLLAVNCGSVSAQEIFDVVTGKHIAQIPFVLTIGSEFAFYFSLDNSYLTTGRTWGWIEWPHPPNGLTKRIRVYRSRTGQFVTETDVSAAMFADAIPEHRWSKSSALGKSQQVVEVLHLAKGEVRSLAALTLHEPFLTDIGTSHDGSRLFTASARSTGNAFVDNSLRVWDAVSGKLIQEWKDSSPRPFGLPPLMFAPGDGYLCSRNHEKMTEPFFVWSLPGAHLLLSRRIVREKERIVAINADGSLIACSTRAAPDVVIRDVVTGAETTRMHGDTGSPSIATFSRDGQLLLTDTSSGKVIWNVKTGAMLKKVDEVPVTFREPRKFVVSGTIEVYHGESQQLLFTLPNARAAALSPDGKTVVAGLRDGRVQWCDATTGQTQHSADGLLGDVACVAISRDGRLLATGDNHGALALWNMADGVRHVLFLASPDGLERLAFASKDSSLVTISSSGTARIWDVQRLLDLPTSSTRKE